MTQPPAVPAVPHRTWSGRCWRTSRSAGGRTASRPGGSASCWAAWRSGCSPGWCCRCTTWHRHHPRAGLRRCVRVRRVRPPPGPVHAHLCRSRARADHDDDGARRRVDRCPVRPRRDRPLCGRLGARPQLRGDPPGRPAVAGVGGPRPALARSHLPVGRPGRPVDDGCAHRAAVAARRRRVRAAVRLRRPAVRELGRRGDTERDPGLRGAPGVRRGRRRRSRARHQLLRDGPAPGRAGRSGRPSAGAATLRVAGAGAPRRRGVRALPGRAGGGHVRWPRLPASDDRA